MLLSDKVLLYKTSCCTLHLQHGCWDIMYLTLAVFEISQIP